jgi:SAM-dependent methyltransferase
MTTDLSFRRPNPMTRGIEFFYTDLHEAMYDLGDIKQAAFPTAGEFREILASIFPNGLADAACLDAGCGGTAVNVYSLVVHGATNVAAIDINTKSIELAQSRLPLLAKAAVTFKTGSLLALPYPNESFDFIVCSGVIHHTPNPELALRELFRVAKPGSVLFISVYCFEASLTHWAVWVWRKLAWVIPFKLLHKLFSWSKTVNNFVLDHMYVPLIWIYRANDFTCMLNRIGLHVERTNRSVMDPFPDGSIIGKVFSGDGLMRVFICRRNRP